MLHRIADPLSSLTALALVPGAVSDVLRRALRAAFDQAS
jgi:hypothetical protein